MASLVDLCVNAVSQCKGLKSQLLCALRAMACPAEKKYGYTDLLEAMNVSDKLCHLVSHQLTGQHIYALTCARMDTPLIV